MIIKAIHMTHGSQSSTSMSLQVTSEVSVSSQLDRNFAIGPANLGSGEFLRFRSLPFILSGSVGVFAVFVSTLSLLVVN